MKSSTLLSVLPFASLIPTFAIGAAVAGSDTITLYLVGDGSDSDLASELPSVSLSNLGVNADGSTTTYKFDVIDGGPMTATFTDPTGGVVTTTTTQPFETAEATMVAGASHYMYSYSATPTSADDEEDSYVEIDDCSIDVANSQGNCVQTLVQASFTQVNSYSGGLAPFATLAVAGNSGSGTASTASPTSSSNAASGSAGKTAFGIVSGLSIILGVASLMP